MSSKQGKARTGEVIDTETGEVMFNPHYAAMANHPKGKPLTPGGAEVPDPVPMAPPVGYVKQPSMFEHMREMIRRELSQAAAESGVESFEDADDFEVGDDYDPRSPYEEEFEGVSVRELDERIAELRRRAEVRNSELARMQAARTQKALAEAPMGSAGPSSRQGQPEAAGGTLDVAPKDAADPPGR